MMASYLLIFNWMDIRNPKAGGQEKYCYEIAKRFVQEGKSVAWIASGFPGGDKREVYDGIEIWRTGSLFTVYPLSIFPYLKMRKAKYVLISINAIPFIAPFHRKKRMIMLHHRIEYKVMKEKIGLLGLFSLIFQDYINPLLYHRDHIIVNSESSKAEFEYIGYRNITIVKTGVDTPNVNFHDKSLLVVAPGPVRPWKHHEFALKAFAVVDEKWSMAIFGSFENKEYEDYLRNYAKELGIDKRVIFYGRIEEDKLFEIYSRSKICVLASEKEGWGLTAMEAQSFGCPVIGFDVPGIRDSVKNGSTGILVKFGDIISLGNALKNLSEDESMLRQISQNAYMRAREYDWEICYEEFKREILKLG